MSAPLNEIALDPRANVVVEACAGSGKTWLLVSRIVRLLLDGVPPSSILAITFTRKAAREMAWRLEQGLRLLARGDDADVATFLRDREIPEAMVPSVVPRARTLMETVLNARPGITISTFHSWFLELLQRAPIEQSLGALSLAESTSQLMDETWRDFAARLASGADTRLVEAFDLLVSRYELAGTRSLLTRFVSYRAEWWAYTTGRDDPVAWSLDQLVREMAVPPTVDAIAAFADDASLRDDIRQFADLLERNGTKTDAAFSQSLRRALEHRDVDAMPVFESLRDSVLKADGASRERKPTGAGEKRLGAEGQARLIALHDALSLRVRSVLAVLRDQAMYRVNEAVFVCGTRLVDTLQSLKRVRGVLDFTDVEWTLSTLLTRSDDAAYMLHRMDARYRHILVDEFQDTNPLQWRALLAWIEASADAGDPPRIFLVGDPKQSIYRFRRAEARLFRRAADYLEERYDARRFSQDESRRCAAPILEIVNRVFLNEPTFDGFRAHAAHGVSLPGRVEVLPMYRAAATDDVSNAVIVGLRNPLITARADPELRGRQLEAVRVAEQIGRLVGHWRIRDGSGDRPAHFGDVMILARARTHLLVFESALRDAGIPYATARHGGLLQRLETEDLQSLLRFLATPFSDLDLARTLRSPMFSCEDDDLMRLASTGDGTWWERLGRCAAQGAATANLARAHTLIRGWIDALDHLPVHDLLDRIHHEADVVARYRAAVPVAMRDAVTANLHAFVELALALDAGRYPSLPRFLDALRELEDGDAEEAPDEGIPEDAGDTVRILTIHGAKGLEAPIVFLIDAHTMSRPDSYHALVEWPPDADRPTHFSMRTRSEDDCDAQRAVYEEDRRLAAREELNALYVAMTRARQCLFVSGNEGARRLTARTWYRRVEEAMGASIDEGGAWGDDLSARAAQPIPVPGDRVAAIPVDWRTMRQVGSRGNAFSTPETERGERVHVLLQRLAPPAVESDLEDLRERLCIPADVFQEDLSAARSILDHPALAKFFDPSRYLSARSEVPCVGAAGELRRMDRVVEFADEIWVLDYKTGAAREADGRYAVAPEYVAQMRDYAAIARALWPGKRIRTALIHAGGTLVEVDDS